VLFEIPTSVIADTWGRRTSYLLGAATLLVSTLSYLAMWHLRPTFRAWAAASMIYAPFLKGGGLDRRHLR
jgi:hypothetical protein